MPKPYDRTLHDGKTVDWYTHAALLTAEIRLGYRLTIVQGSYHKGVGASAGTHDGGGCIDLAPAHWADKVRVLREVGFAIWHRTTIPGLWNEHCHGVLVGNKLVSPAAHAQVTDYFNGRNGLKGHAADHTARPNPIPTFKWPGSDGALALEAHAKALLDAPKKPATPKPATGVVYGMDGSHHNAVDILSADRQGFDYFSAKCTEGNEFVDASYNTKRKQAAAAGILFSAYHFLHHGDVDKQAANLAAHIGDKSIPFDVDAEVGGKPIWSDITGFVAACEKRGLTLGKLYLPRSWWRAIGSPSLKGYTVWNAAYPTSAHGRAATLYPGNGNERWNAYGGVVPMFWQFTSTGRIDGYAGDLDLNAFRGSLADLKKLCVFKDYSATPAPKPVPPVVVKPKPAKPVAPQPAVKATPFPRWLKTDPALMIFHAPEGDPYPHANSLRGIDWAVSFGANAIDHDVHVTKDGHLVNTHWGKPLQHGFVDGSGKHKFGSDVSVSELTLAEVSQFYAQDGGYTINSLAVDAAKAASLGVTLCLEQKGDVAFTQVATWEKAYAEIQAAGAQAIVMSLPDGDMEHASAALLAAGRAGFRTMLLTRGAVPKAFYDVTHLSAVKGSTARNIGLPAGVVRLGTSAVNATRYGCSVSTGGTTGASRVIRAKGGKPTFYHKES